MRREEGAIYPRKQRIKREAPWLKSKELEVKEILHPLGRKRKRP